MVPSFIFAVFVNMQHRFDYGDKLAVSSSGVLCVCCLQLHPPDVIKLCPEMRSSDVAVRWVEHLMAKDDYAMSGTLKGTRYSENMRDRDKFVNVPMPRNMYIPIAFLEQPLLEKSARDRLL